ncbi:MAG: CheR family methyltransferase [Thiobacillus sp.]
MRPTLPDSLLSPLSALLAARIGLHFPKERWGDLERGIAAAAAAFDMPDAASCAQRLLSAPLTHREIEILASHLTVGETYFFREPRSLDAFEQHILPVLLHARAHNARRLRIWCAGCCTGEEPYSIAMLLDRLIPDHETWHVTLLATDINPLFLRKAAEGEYADWSFRATPDWMRERYFKRKRDGRYALHPRIRKKVTFSYLNLAEDVYPSLSNNTNAMDVIFCRNVLMYFTAERISAVIGQLYRSLVDGGWLIVSPAETSSVLFSRFTSVAFAGATLYRKSVDADAPRFVSPVPAPMAEPEPWRALPLPPALPEVAAAPAPASLAAAPHGTGTPAQAARDCANQGRLDEAVAWCREAIAADKLNPAGYYLLATVQQEQGQNDDAMQSLQRALYLDSGFVLAHFALGNLCRSQGRQREAQRHFDNAQSLLRAHPPDEVLPESEGLSAGRLGEIIASVQSSMPRTTAGR